MLYYAIMNNHDIEMLHSILFSLLVSSITTGYLKFQYHLLNKFDLILFQVYVSVVDNVSLIEWLIKSNLGK